MAALVALSQLLCARRKGKVMMMILVRSIPGRPSCWMTKRIKSLSDEQVHHNKVMEDASKWKAKNNELKYRFNLLKKYQEMKDMKNGQKTDSYAVPRNVGSCQQ